jgi:site-specific DNA-methyltransferase (adenine-specific)
MNTVEIFNQDALDFMAKVPDGFVDVLITDPPYWTLDKWRNMGTTTRLGGHGNKDKQRGEMFFETIDREYLWEWFLEADRVLKLDGHLYIFCDDIVQPILSNWIRERKGEHRFGECHTLVWDKQSIGMGYHYRRRYEFIVFAWREKRKEKDGGLVRGFTPRKLRDLGKADVFQYNRITNGYPTQKPAPLVAELVTQSARIGDVLCDPFAGSGVLAEATPFDYNSRILLNDKYPASMQWIVQNGAAKAELLGFPESFRIRDGDFAIEEVVAG